MVSHCSHHTYFSYSALVPCSERESYTVAPRPPSRPRLAPMGSVPTMSPVLVSSLSPPEQVFIAQFFSNLISLVIIVGLLKYNLRRNYCNFTLYSRDINISLPRLCSWGAAHYALGPCRLCHCCWQQGILDNVEKENSFVTSIFYVRVFKKLICVCLLMTCFLLQRKSWNYVGRLMFRHILWTTKIHPDPNLIPFLQDRPWPCSTAYRLGYLNMS